MSVDDITRASKDLFFFFIEDLLKEKEKLDEIYKEPPSITLSEYCNIIPGRGSNDEDAVASIFDMRSAAEVAELYNNLKREKDPRFQKIKYWAMSYKLSMNHLFGL